ncbi:MAG: hypothetical protein MSC30_04885 [Gaiellaceae bacterium MAG52_C11]|nr:hypothetical protein [Candidatus Gaiellasilicea maunaloa]
MPLVHFLIVFDRADQQVVTAERFVDGELAAERYAAMEREHGNEPNMEIVLVGSDSIETVRRTHGNYFGDEAGLPFRELVS